MAIPKDYVVHYYDPFTASMFEAYQMRLGYYLWVRWGWMKPRDFNALVERAIQRDKDERESRERQSEETGMHLPSA